MKFPYSHLNTGKTNMSNEKEPGWLGYIGDYTTPIFMGIIIPHYKDPQKTNQDFNGK